MPVTSAKLKQPPEQSPVPPVSRKLPIGIQDFPSLKKDNYLYVDKTEYIYNLINTGKYYFLSRPRRFGKSLLTSTMAAYWEGRKELFKGLKIEAHLTDVQAWPPHPVFYFDFNGETYHEASTALESSLNEHLTAWEKQYNVQKAITQIEDKEGISELGLRFRYVVLEAYRQTGKRAVILVDEYDKPLLEVMDKPEFEERNRYIFKGFFSSLKKLDKYIKFVFITGVTKFEKVSIFSDLNQLRDISFSKEYAGICGITEQEMREYFLPEILAVAEEQCLSTEECFTQLKQKYDGYHFYQNGVGVYNPFSLLNAFADKAFGSYWFSTGTPTFLVNRITNTDFDVKKLTDSSLYADEQTLSDYRADNPDLVPLLYQTGYLTIVGFDSSSGEYTLSFPNNEVKYGFLKSLIKGYSPKYGSSSGKNVFALKRHAETGNLDGIKDVLTALFSSMPYSTTKKKDPVEHYFQSMFFLIFTLLGELIECEIHSANGRADCILTTKKFIYLFEFKINGRAEEALKQIDEKGYALPFAAEYERKLYKIGVVFDSKKRTLKDWKVAEG
ncbi:MAG: ATP-binding protein [Synergistaceae bacterium]|nr:ATP-binding protein [Synergistaceae bacterium]